MSLCILAVDICSSMLVSCRNCVGAFSLYSYLSLLCCSICLRLNLLSSGENYSHPLQKEVVVLEKVLM